MAFRIAARTLLELGAELISSDGIALYELIKNSVDAGSKTVTIRVFVTMTHTHFDMALERLARKGETVSDVKDWISNNLEEDAPRKLLTDFKRRISKATTKNALRNALSDAYDAFNWIEVEDTGDGMSRKDLEDIYLTIGTRSRRAEKDFMDSDVFDFDESPEPERIVLGDKGIGRLSTMRLGERLEVTTTQKGESYFNVLHVDWLQFSHDTDQFVEDIDIKPARGAKKTKRAFQGTTVTIRHLKSDWTQRKFQNFINSDSARLVDPFESRRANRLLQFHLNDQRYRLPEVPKKLLESPHAWGKAKFFRSKKTGKLAFQGEVHYPLRGDWKKNFRLEEVEMISLIAGVKGGWTIELPRSALEKLGRFKVEFYWFNRRILTEIDGLGTRRDVQQEVARWAGGLMVFRDGFRVNPYGGPDDDWLELDKRAFAAKGYKVNRNQIVGRVNISWRNRFLIDQTNREGLVDTAQKAALRRLLQHLLTTEFRPFLDQVDAEFKAQELEDIESIDLKIARARTDAERKVLELIKSVPDEEQSLNELHSLIKQLASYVDEAKQVAQLYEDERSKFVYLAGIGLMVEFILHELGRASSHALGFLQEMDRQNIPRHELSTLSNLSDQLKTLQKRVETLDPLSTSRRQRKENFDVYDVISELVDSHGGEINRHRINVKGNFDDAAKWNVKAVKGMFIQIIENLIANSFYWLKVQNKIDEKFHPWVSIELDPDEKTIAFSDNGPGIAPEDAENIFQAFFTRKPPGEGKGLGLYICREIAQYHDWELYVLEAPTKKTGRLNTFLLDMR